MTGSNLFKRDNRDFCAYVFTCVIFIAIVIYCLLVIALRLTRAYHSPPKSQKWMGHFEGSKTWVFGWDFALNESILSKDTT